MWPGQPAKAAARPSHTIIEILMDDHRTKETLDALADLFLTGTTPPPRKPQADSDAPVGASVRTPPRKSPSAALAPTVVASHDTLDAMAATHAQVARALDVLDELDGPGAFTLGTPEPSASRYDDDDNHPAASAGPSLRLHDESAPDQARGEQHARIEALFLGNLPGFAGPWLTQYAFHVAQQRGPAGVLHLAGDRVDLELVTADRQTVRPGVDDTLVQGADVDALLQRIEQLTGNRAAPVNNWIIHLPSPGDPVQLARARTIAHWTVLCGGDDMAIAAATRMLQTMLADGASGGAPEAAGRRIGVMIMGSDDAKAREAVAKLNAAAAGFLRQPIELLGSRRQMTPVHMRPLGGCASAEVWPVLQRFFGDLTAPPPIAASPVYAAPAHPAITPIESETPVYDTHASAIMEPPSEVEHLTGYQPSSVAAPHPQRRTPESQPSSSPRAPRAAQPAPQREPAVAVDPAPSSINEPNLIDLLTGSLAGGLALQARHPRQRDTQFLLDQAGKLHLLRRQVGSDLRTALVDLLETRDWVREHIELLALTQRQCAFDTSAEPTLHLFTADAKNAVAMVNKLGPFVKLHLLQEVRIGTTKTWVCTDLN
jgi:hypothetical protein